MKEEAGVHHPTPASIPPEFDIERFVRVQDRVVPGEWPLGRTEYQRALQELCEGKTSSCSQWIWFVFPRVFGLGKCANSRFYGLKSADEAQRYLAHPVLGPRLRAGAQQILLCDPGKVLVLGAQVKSCITLFATVSVGAEDSVFFMRVLERAWAGRSCAATLAVLDAWASNKMGK